MFITVAVAVDKFVMQVLEQLVVLEEMVVGVDKAGHHCFPAGVEYLFGLILPGDLSHRTDSYDATLVDSHGPIFNYRLPFVNGDDQPVLNQNINLRHWQLRVLTIYGRTHIQWRLGV